MQRNSCLRRPDDNHLITWHRFLYKTSVLVIVPPSDVLGVVVPPADLLAVVSPPPGLLVVGVVIPPPDLFVVVIPPPEPAPRARTTPGAGAKVGSL